MKVFPLFFITQNHDYMDYEGHEYTVMWAIDSYPVGKIPAKFNTLLQRQTDFRNGYETLALP